MTAMLRSWRTLILAWAVLLAPQIALTHELSHDLPAGPSQHDSDKHHHVATKVCVSCLAFAQIGSALPFRFDWIPRMLDGLPRLAGVAFAAVAAHHMASFDARGPPLSLT